MTTLRSALQKELSDNIEYGELILATLKRKAEQQLQITATAQDERLVEILRALVDMQTIQNRLAQERYRLSVLQG